MKKGIKKRNSVKVIIFLVTLAVILITAGFSAFQASLNIGEIGAVVRLQKDIRVTGMTLNSRTNGAVSKYEAYSVKKVSSTMDLPNSNSTVTYDVEITNIGNVEMGILDIAESFKLNGNNSSNLEIKSINGYDLYNTSMLCDDNDNSLCKLGSVTTLEITIGYTNNGYNSSNTEYEMELEFDFNFLFFLSQKYATLSLSR